MANYREYNAKLRQLQGMRRVTGAMKMLATTKLARAQAMLTQAQGFGTEWRHLLRMAEHLVNRQNPLVAPRAKPENVFVLMLTANMGLCGGFNNNLIRLVGRWLDENAARYRILRFSFCGRKGYQHFRRQVEVRAFYEQAVRHPDLTLARRLSREVFTPYVEGKYDEIYLARNRYFSPLWQEPVVERLLPVDLSALPPAPAGREPDVLLEPHSPRLLTHVLELHVCQRIFSALWENASGEHAARMTAMDSAAKNIDHLCQTYTLLRNRARQDAITTELTEVVAGAEALH